MLVREEQLNSRMTYNHLSMKNERRDRTENLEKENQAQKEKL